LFDDAFWRDEWGISEAADRAAEELASTLRTP
jgi:hypothetical protein